MRGVGAGGSDVWPSGSGSAAGSTSPELARVVARASRDAKGAPPDLLDGYLDLLVEVSRTGRRLTPAELDGRRAMGARAAERGVPLRATVDIYLSATWLAWPLLPGVADATRTESLRRIGERIFRAADASIVAVAEGYEVAQRLAIRREEARRREFVDDLLVGRYDPGVLAERSQRYGVPLAATYVVAVVEAEKRLEELGPTVQRVERELTAVLAPQNVLVTTKDDLLVCVASAEFETMAVHLVRILDSVLGGGTEGWRVALGRTHSDLSGIRRSYEEARSALDLSRRLGLVGRLFKAADLQVFQVLLRDAIAITDLVGSVLGPLHRSRLGVAAFLKTLEAYFASGAVATVAARELHVGVRTVTHRLARVRELTGYSVDDPLQRYTLETAVLGARLLGWPAARQPSSLPPTGKRA